MIRDFPTLESRHVEGGKLYATREDLAAAQNLPDDPHIAEIGVALGEFSQFLIERFRPARFHAFDLFLLHEDATIWGMPTSEVLGGKTHLNFYRDLMGSDVMAYQGKSSQHLPGLADESLDLIYIDGAHDYDTVSGDAEQSARIVKPDGVLIFNDYIMYDPFLHADYGVVPVVNELVVNQGWKVIGFALQKHLFCDIAIARR